MNIGHPLLCETKPYDLRPDVLFLGFTDVAAVIVRGFGILTNTSKIFRKCRYLGDRC